MSDYVLEAEMREKTGRGESRRLRRSGRLPAVIYGGGKQELPITLDAHSLSKLLREESFFTSMIELKVAGKRGSDTALLKDVQWDPVRDDAVHLDFHRVASSDTVHAEVPVHAINHEKCPGVVMGGVLEIIRHSLEVVCRADSIPESIEVDCADMNIGDSVHIVDLHLPEGVEAPHDVNFTILTVAAPTKIVEPTAEAEEVEEAEEAEGEAETEAESGE